MKPFQSVVDALATDLDGPWFRAHLTLGTAVQRVKNIHTVKSVLSAQKLIPSEIVSTPDFTKSLYVRFVSTEALWRARAALIAQPEFKIGRAFDPHISLCYGPPPMDAEKRADVKALLDTSVQFATLVEMEITPPVDSYDAVRAWREIQRWAI